MKEFFGSKCDWSLLFHWLTLKCTYKALSLWCPRRFICSFSSSSKAFNPPKFVLISVSLHITLQLMTSVPSLIVSSKGWLALMAVFFFNQDNSSHCWLHKLRIQMFKEGSVNYFKRQKILKFFISKGRNTNIEVLTWQKTFVKLIP